VPARAFRSTFEFGVVVIINYRMLGNTGFSVSSLGYGTWGVASAMWVGTDEDEAVRALHVALDARVNFIDTALAYGDGRSERLVGKVVRNAGEQVYIASKVPPMEWPEAPGMHAPEAFTADWIIKCTERTLTNLGVETIDLQQLHVWSDDWLGEGDWAEGVERLRQDGKIRSFGISTLPHEPQNALAAIRAGLVDTVQVVYNVFDQSPEDELLPAAQEAGVGIIARVPFDEGGLTGTVTRDATFPDGDWRNAYFAGDRKAHVADRTQALTQDLGIAMEALPEVALRFCQSHPAVSTVIPGMRTPAHVRGNVRATADGPLSDRELATLRRHRWMRNYYEDE
jgi:aryl-alcohol dehydrogenase-like predicted oxidoreductase